MLSPYLFSVYIDGVVYRVRECRVGCFAKSHCVSVLLYADDILLLAPSVTALQQLVLASEGELQWLEMSCQKVSMYAHWSSFQRYLLKYQHY